MASIWPLSHKAEICEVLQRLLSFQQVLPSQPRNSVVLLVVIGFLVTSLTKVLLARLPSLVGRPALGRVWVVPYPFHFLMMEFTVLLGTFNTQEIVLYPSPDLCLLTILPRNYTDSSMDFLVVSALTCTVNGGTLYRKVCFFLNHVQSIEMAHRWTPIKLWRHLKVDQRKLDAPELNLECHSKGVEYLLMHDI